MRIRLLVENPKSSAMQWPKKVGFRLNLEQFRLELESAKVFGRTRRILGHFLTKQGLFRLMLGRTRWSSAELKDCMPKNVGTRPNKELIGCSMAEQGFCGRTTDAGWLNWRISVRWWPNKGILSRKSKIWWTLGRNLMLLMNFLKNKSEKCLNFDD